MPATLKLFKAESWLVWLNYGLILAGCYVALQFYPPQIIGQLAGGSIAIFFISGVMVAARFLLASGSAPPRPLNWRGSRLLTGVGLASVSFTLTAGAINSLPPPLVMQSQAQLLELVRFYELVYYLLLAYIAFSVLEVFWPISLAEIGLSVILSYGVLNGGFFGILETELSPLFYSLTLITVLAYLVESPPPPAKNPLLLPAVGLALVGGLATWQALYFHYSWIRWLALVNWIIIFWLLTTVVRRWSQLNRLLALLLVVIGLVAGAGLANVWAIAGQIGWAKALSLRLSLGYVAHNGLAIAAGTFLILSLGLLFIWRNWWQRGLLLALTGLLLALLVLTYSRTGMVGLGAGLGLLALGQVYHQARFNRAMDSSSILKQKRTWLLLALIALVITALVSLSFVGRAASLNYRVLTTLSWRVYLWQVAWQTISQHPWLGVGLHNSFHPSFYQVLSLNNLQTVRSFIAVTHNHNLLLEIGVSLGWVGLTVAVWLGLGAAQFAWQTVTRPHSSASQWWLTLTLCAAGATWLTGHLLVMSLSERSLIADSGWLLLALLIIAGREDLDSVQAGPPALSRPRLAGLKQLFYAGSILLVVLVVVVRPLWVTSLRRQAEAALAAGDQPGLARAMAQVFRLEPWDADVRSWFGQATRDPAEAIARYEQALALRPGHAPYYERLGWLHWRQNNLPAALTAFQQAVTLDSYDVTGPYHASLGYAYAATGRREEAITALQTALAHRLDFVQAPDWQVINSDLALSPAYTASPAADQVDPALGTLIDYHLGWGWPAPISTTVAPPLYLSEVLLPANRADAPSGWLLQRQATLYNQWQLYDRTEALLKQFPSRPSASNGGPGLSQRHFYQGYLALQQGRLLEAQSEFEAVRSANQGNPAGVHYYLGLTYQEQGRLAAALAEYEQLLRLRRALFYVTDTEWLKMGAAFGQAGQIEPALEAYALAQFEADSPVEYAEIQLALNEIYLTRQQPAPVLTRGKQVLTSLPATVPASTITETILRPLAAQMAQAYQQTGTPAEAALRQQTHWLQPLSPTGEVYLNLLAETMNR